MIEDEAIQKLDFILLDAGYACHNGDWNFKNISSPFTRIHYVEQGTAKIIRNDGVYTLSPNHLYLTPTHCKHGYACNEHFTLYYIHIYENTNLKMSIFDQFDFPVEVEANPIDILLIKRLLEINPGRELKAYDPRSYDNTSMLLKNIAQSRLKSVVSKIETQAILQVLFSRFMVHVSDKQKNIDNRIFKILLYINKNICKPISINELVEICCLNKDYFMHLFKKEMKCTPIQYINLKKIEKAQLMMLIKGIRIKEIAYSISIDNIPYFNRLFKKITGQTPSVWIKENRISNEQKTSTICQI
jgi:AraC-like DNA-binding protein